MASDGSSIIIMVWSMAAGMQEGIHGTGEVAESYILIHNR